MAPIFFPCYKILFPVWQELRLSWALVEVEVEVADLQLGELNYRVVSGLLMPTASRNSIHLLQYVKNLGVMQHRRVKW